MLSADELLAGSAVTTKVEIPRALLGTDENRRSGGAAAAAERA